ncbi:MAG: hypothetical protein KGL16_09020, partial [Acidobacteriota bacterium]|nr:hypothetical protein [Acidobacteriota bacterium]
RVYADGRAPLSDRAHLMAPLLTFVGKEVWLSGQAASMGWQLEPLALPYLEVTIVAMRTPGQRAGLRVRSVRVPPHRSEICNRHGLVLSSIPRLLIEVAAAGGGGEQLEKLLEAAIRKNLLDITDLAATLARHARRAGTVAVHGICEEYLPRIDGKSGLERAFARWLVRHPEFPEPERNIYLGPFEIDCYWRDHRLALELDGRPYHSIIADIEKDNRKNAWLQIHGIRILRITDRRWRTDRRGAEGDLAAFLALAKLDGQQTGEGSPAAPPPAAQRKRAAV